MNFIRFFEDITKRDVESAGGKGASLGELTRAGISVPPGFVVTAQAFEKLLADNGLGIDIRSVLESVNSDDMNSVERASEKIRDMIHDTGMPDSLAAEIIAAYKKLNAPLVAVRSSATAEDSSVASWAGELETYLNTGKETLLKNVVKCWSSLFTPRAIFYRFEKKLGDKDVHVAVVVQAMIQSTVSGICFTVHPVTQDPNQMIIEAGWGLGEAIVSGAITPDSYIIDKEEELLLDIQVNEQEKQLTRKESGNEWSEVSQKKKGAQKLAGSQIMELAALCRKIESHYGCPQDIEWAFQDGTFYITQSRPITTLS